MTVLTEKDRPGVLSGGSFYEDMPEPVDYETLLLQLEETNNLMKLIGNINDEDDRQKAVEILTNSADGRIIGTMVGGRTAGFIFDPQDINSVEAVIRIKSLGGSVRRDLFPVICTLETALDLIDGQHIAGISLENLAGESFIRVPVNSEKAELLPANLKSQEGDRVFVQFFIPPRNSHLEEIVTRATENYNLPLLAGTSMNYTSQDPLTHRSHAARFCVTSSVYWLDAEPVTDIGKRGSYTIIGVESGQMTVLRQGNMPFENLLSLANIG